MIDLPEAKDQLALLAPHLITAHEAAMTAYVTEVKQRPEFTLPFGPTTRAQVLHDHICAEVEQRVVNLYDIEINDKLGFFGLMVGDDILLRFKYVGHGAPANVATEQQKLLASQTYNDQMMLRLTGDVDLAPPTLLTCGYTIDGEQIGRIEIRRDCKAHLSWSYDIYGGDTIIVPQALPGQEDTTKPARITKKVAAQGEDAASANGAS
jgi:hypothetical protein